MSAPRISQVYKSKAHYKLQVNMTHLQITSLINKQQSIQRLYNNGISVP